MSDAVVPLGVSFASDDAGLVVRVEGDLDAASADGFVQAVEEKRPLTAVTIDVGNLAFVDSAGLRAFLAIRQMADADNGAPLSLRAIGPDLQKLLEICGLVDAFDRAD